MVELPCPACGAGVAFRSRVAVFAVCSFCDSMIVRHDLNVEALGTMAELPPDVSLLQLGARGRYEGRYFELVGRLKISWENGNWNEWYALFDDGTDGWLAEAQGFLSMSFAVPAPVHLPLRQALVPGNRVQLEGRAFSVDDIKEATCVGSQGELPFRGAQGRKSISVDLSAPGRGFGCLDYSDDGVRLYLGKYVEFDDLKLDGLRELDGW